MKLKQLRQMLGLSQASFAKQFNISQNTLSNYENGNRTISFDLLKEISQKYQCPIDYLLDNDQICDGRLPSALKMEREANGYTLEMLSKETKIPLPDLKSYEEGLEPINKFLLEIICKTYGITIFEFYNKNDMYDDYIPEIFNGDADIYENFKEAKDKDAQKEDNKIPVLDEPEIRWIARKSLNNDPKKIKKLRKVIEALLSDDEDDD